MPHQIRWRVIESGSWVVHPKNGVYMYVIVHFGNRFSAEINDYDRIFIFKASFFLAPFHDEDKGRAEWKYCTFTNLDRRFFRVNQFESIFDLSVILSEQNR